MALRPARWRWRPQRRPQQVGCAAGGFGDPARSGGGEEDGGSLAMLKKSLGWRPIVVQYMVSFCWIGFCDKPPQRIGPGKPGETGEAKLNSISDAVTAGVNGAVAARPERRRRARASERANARAARGAGGPLWKEGVLRGGPKADISKYKNEEARPWKW